VEKFSRAGQATDGNMAPNNLLSFTAIKHVGLAIIRQNNFTFCEPFIVIRIREVDQ